MEHNHGRPIRSDAPPRTGTDPKLTSMTTEAIPLLIAWLSACAALAASESARITSITASTTRTGAHQYNPLHTLDGDLTSCWSVHGDGQWVCYGMSRPLTVGRVSIAWAAGDERRYKFGLLASDDGRTWSVMHRGVSTGRTCDLEAHEFPPVQTRFLKIVGHGSDKNRWVNILEVQIEGAHYLPPLSSEFERFPQPAHADDREAVVYAVTNRPSLRPALPENTVDRDEATVWCAQAHGHWLTYHLSRPTEISRVQVAWDEKESVKFDVRTSTDGRRWTTAYSGHSRAGRPREFEPYSFSALSARFVRLVVYGSTRRRWFRVAEVRVGDLPYRPSPAMQWWSRRWESGPASEAYLRAFEPARPQSYTATAVRCLDTLVEAGTDRYGAVQSPIWVLNLDLETLDCFPRYNDRLVERGAQSLSYSSTAPYGVGYRAIRGSQREAGCSNLFVDQPMVRAALLHDRLTGDKRFTPAVDAYIRWYYTHLWDGDKGLLEWGVHTSYDVFDEALRHEDGRQHEVHTLMPVWPAFSRVDPEKTKTYLSRFWYWHTDPKTGRVDRHATRGRGLDFAMAAGEIVLACAYLHTLEPDGPWLDRALQVARSHWNSRNRDTGLFVNTPYGGKGERFDNTYSDTSVTGYWASRVLLAGRLTGNAELTAMARGILRSWARYGWDGSAGKPWASLRPDGTPNTKRRDYSATLYSKFDPSGHWDFWKDYVYGFEAPFATLMTYAAAAQWLDDPALRAHAVRLAECYRRLLPANGRVGTFAANYGQLISFFLAMEELTGDRSYHSTATQIADEAVHHLWTGRLFRGFAGRTHYTAIEGAGYLVQALLELEADPSRLADLRRRDVFLWNF